MIAFQIRAQPHSQLTRSDRSFRTRLTRRVSLGPKRGERFSISASSIQQATLLGNDPWGIWAALSLAGCAGLWAEQTKLGKEMSGALLSTLAGLCLSNLNIIPAEAPHVYNVVNSYLLPLAVPLLLFSADLRKVIRDTGRLLPAFLLGAFATVAGSFIAFALLPLKNLGNDGWKVAASLCGRHIGGSVNYVAISEQLQLSPAARMAGLAADDLIVSIYFVVLYALARKQLPEEPLLDEHTSSADDGKTVTVLHGATAIAVSAVLCYLGTTVARVIGYRGGSITVITALTVTLATAVPGFLAPLISSGNVLAAIMMQLFFASVGASGSIAVVINTAPMLFMWSFIAISIHLGLCLAFEKIFKFSRKEIVLASNANIGGPTTAAGMAAAKGWRSSLVPALLIGILGYSIATFIGVGMSEVFRRMQFGI